jgi:plasmid maintenance system antidote protein VapI
MALKSEGAPPSVRIRIPEFKAELFRRGMTQRELARRLEIAESDMSWIVHGRRRLSLETAVAIADELGVDVEVIGESMQEAAALARCAGGGR